MSKRMSAAEDDQILYLFSSNLQPLYVRNVLTFLASPRGLRHTLRYDETWVDADTRPLWADNDLVGKEVLLHFSLQHRGQYTPAAFIPVRKARVVQSERDGSIYFVTVAVTDDVALREPPDPGGLPDWRKRHPESVIIEEYGEQLRKIGAPVPYTLSAGFLSKPNQLSRLKTVMAMDLDPAIALQRNARYLSGVEALSSASFVRLLQIRDVSSGSVVALKHEMNVAKRPVYVLDGGSTYELEFFNYHPQPVTRTSRFTITPSNDAVTAVGWSGFEVASRYDRPTVMFRTAKPVGGGQVEAVLAIRPDAEMGGASLDVPLAVRTRGPRLAAEVAASSAVLLLLGVAAMSQGDGRWIFGSAALVLGAVMQVIGWVVPGISGAVQSAFKGSPPPAGSQQPAGGHTGS